MRLLLVPDPTAPNGVDAFSEAITYHAVKHGHQAVTVPLPKASESQARQALAEAGAREGMAILINSFQPAALDAAKALGLRVIVRLIDAYAGAEAAEVEDARRRVVEARAVMVPSRYLEGVLRDWGLTGPIHVVPYAYEQILAREVAVVTVRASRTGFGIVAGGRLNAATRLGFESLLRALARLRPDYHLSLFGSGPAEEALRALAAPMLSTGQVTMLGDIPQPKILEYMRASKAYVDPCGLDGFPVYALHALSEGCPVVAVRQGAVLELISHQENGLLVSPGEPASIAEALVTLSSVQGLSLKLIAGGIRTVEDHSWDATAEAAWQAIAGAS